LRLLRAQHDTTLEQLETTHAQLLRAEKSLDRAQSVTLAAIAGSSTPLAQQPHHHLAKPSPEVESPFPASPRAGFPTTMDQTAEMERIEKEKQKLGDELEVLNEIVERRAKDIDELRNDRVRLGIELDTLKLKVKVLPFPLSILEVLTINEGTQWNSWWMYRMN
jgi:hypothetical protein